MPINESLMPFPVACYKPQQWGLIHTQRFFPIREKLSTTADVIKFLEEQKISHPGKVQKGVLGDGIDVDRLTFQSPITQPCQVVCQGKNYIDHIKEMGARPEDKTFNLFFVKATSSLQAADKSQVLRPAQVDLLDYEMELGLVVRTRISRKIQLGVADLSRWLAGLVIANDVSARDIQISRGQWFQGKSYRGFCPVGPYLLYFPKGEPMDLAPLELELKVNGETRQRAQANQMIYPPHETLQELTLLMDFYPGDLILTGTPAGVAFKAPKDLPPGLTELQKSQYIIRSQIEDSTLRSRYLNSGDQLEATIQHPRQKASWDFGLHSWQVKDLPSKDPLSADA